MFQVETQVGAKYGGWLRGWLTYKTYPAAQAQIAALRDAEVRAGVFRFRRRVVAVR